MKFLETPIKDLYVIEPRIWKDERGYFYESYNHKLFKDAGIPDDFVQDNQSMSHKGALRGLHAQSPPYAQGKLVRVIRGRVMDVVVDVRKNSPTYGQNVSIELSGDNHLMFWIPPGFLHGFATLEDHTIFTYKVSGPYNQTSEIGVLWNDPDLNINWGIGEAEIILSEKDKNLTRFKDFTSPF